MACMARVIRARDIMRFEYEDFPELGFRQLGLARFANSAGKVGTVDKLRGIDFGDAAVAAGFRRSDRRGRFRSQMRPETAGPARLDEPSDRPEPAGALTPKRARQDVAEQLELVQVFGESAGFPKGRPDPGAGPVELSQIRGRLDGGLDFLLGLTMPIERHQAGGEVIVKHRVVRAPAETLRQVIGRIGDVGRTAQAIRSGRRAVMSPIGIGMRDQELVVVIKRPLGRATGAILGIADRWLPCSIPPCRPHRQSRDGPSTLIRARTRPPRRAGIR